MQDDDDQDDDDNSLSKINIVGERQMDRVRVRDTVRDRGNSLAKLTSQPASQLNYSAITRNKIH